MPCNLPTLGRRGLLALALTALAASSGTAVAQNYPDKPVKLVVTYPPGGTVDAVARMLGPRLSELLGQPVVIDNRGGAGGLIGGDVVAKSPADGYTLMVDASNHAQNPALRAKMPFDTMKAFAPVSLLVRVPNILLVHPGYPVRSAQELITQARAKPGAVQYASSGPGSSPHLAAELFESMTGVKMTHIAYKGGGPALADVMAGHVPVFFASVGSSIAHIQAGKLTPVAVASKARSAALPQVPTIAESGVPGFEMYEWNAIFAPAGTPQPIVDRLSAAFATVLKDPQLRAKLEGIGAEVIGSTPAELDAFRKAEIDKWSKLAKERGLSLD